MNTIGKECAKEVKEGNNLNMTKKFLESCINAIKSLHELNIYINSYKKDCDYKEKVRILSDRIKNMEVTKLESAYGRMLFHAKMSFRRLNEQKFQDNVYLLCFHSRILIFDIQPTKENVISMRLTHQVQSKDIYVYKSFINVTDSMILMVEEGTNKKNGEIIIRTMNNFIPNNEESFSVKAGIGKELNILRDKFQDLIDSADQTSCPKHRDHKFNTSITKHDISFSNPLPPPTCGECGLYLFGLLFMGYKCQTCGKCYHETCFLKGMPFSGRFNCYTCLYLEKLTRLINIRSWYIINRI